MSYLEDSLFWLLISRFLCGDGKWKSLSLPIQVSRHFSKPSQECANRVSLVLLLSGKYEICCHFLFLVKEYFVENKTFTSNLIINSLCFEAAKYPKRWCLPYFFLVQSFAFTNVTESVELFEWKSVEWVSEISLFTRLL